MPNLPRSRLIASHGQSVVEFAIVLPLMVVILVGIVDLARVYTTMLTVESAAREAADYAAFGSYQWKPDVRANTEKEMTRRACVAARNLPDYVGTDTECTNPKVTFTPVAESCDVATNDPPCDVTVTVRYDFQLLVPLHIELMGASYGLPSTLTIERSSTFAMSDLSLP